MKKKLSRTSARASTIYREYTGLEHRQILRTLTSNVSCKLELKIRNFEKNLGKFEILGGKWEILGKIGKFGVKNWEIWKKLVKLEGGGIGNFEII